MTVYRVTDAQLTTIADAIRQKGGTEGSLTFPGGFADAVGLLGGARPCIEYAVDVNGNVTRAKLYGFTKIPDYFFYHQSALTQVDLSESPGITSIGARAFGSCTRLTLTALPETVTSIGEWAFESCTALALTALPAGVTSLGTRAFANCTNLALTALPAGLTAIPDNAFQSCTHLTFSLLPAAVTSVGNSAFSGCNGLTRLEIACTTLGAGTSIFKNCRGLEAVWIRSGCETIAADSAANAPFNGCSASLPLFAEAAAKPAGWGAYYNRVGTSGATAATVTWNQATRPW